MYQQLFLAHYLDYNLNHLDKLMIQLYCTLEESVRLQAVAKRAWIGFWGIDLVENKAERGLGGEDRDERR